MATVKVEVLGEEVRDVQISDEGATLEVVLVDVDVDGYDVKVNGEEPVEDQMVKDGDVVTLVPNIEGGSR